MTYLFSWSNQLDEPSSSSLSVASSSVLRRFWGSGVLMICLLWVDSLLQLNNDGTLLGLRVFLTGVHLKSSFLKCLEQTTASFEI